MYYYQRENVISTDTSLKDLYDEIRQERIRHKDKLARMPSFPPSDSRYVVKVNEHAVSDSIANRELMLRLKVNAVYFTNIDISISLVNAFKHLRRMNWHGNAFFKNVNIQVDTKELLTLQAPQLVFEEIKNSSKFYKSITTVKSKSNRFLFYVLDNTALLCNPLSRLKTLSLKEALLPSKDSNRYMYSLIRRCQYIDTLEIVEYETLSGAGTFLESYINQTEQSTKHVFGLHFSTVKGYRDIFNINGNRKINFRISFLSPISNFAGFIRVFKNRFGYSLLLSRDYGIDWNTGLNPLVDRLFRQYLIPRYRLRFNF